MNTRAMAWSVPGNQTAARTPYPMSLYVTALFLTLQFIPSFQFLVAFHIIRYLVALWALWGLLFIMESKDMSMRLVSGRRRELSVFALWCLILLSYPFANPQMGVINILLGDPEKLLSGLLPMLMCYSMGLAYAERGESRAFPFLIKWLLVVMAVNALIATPLLLSGGLAVRQHLHEQAGTEVSEQNLLFLGVGSLGFYAAMVFLSPFFADLIVRAKGLKRLLWASLFIPILLTLHLTSLLIIFTTMLLSLLLYSALVTVKLKNSWRYMAGLIGIGFIVIVLMYGLSDSDPFEYQMGKIDALMNPSSGSRRGGHLGKTV